MSVKCAACGEAIPKERLEFVPNCKYCIKCTDSHSPEKIYDPEVICAKASPSGQNGWSPTS